ncbi:inositol monophosphatase family protein [Citreimonas salinaria]|uniref:Myo-inositol-1(Or 4)-monophosphatase n=1 Tax=Citreimonas salinaria TaxID=321339 RepID=A0A1H3I021_9RHOB|nr:3'(2'),5'-bisphosphate nucleotidase CysQ [Citreimonas salinaria]SDY20449.1 myo-inositol-1(or 4)-monophosphatase [Citreimonas salinaria]
MPENDLSLLIDAARRASEEAKAFIGRDLGVENKAADNSPVTRADLAVDRMLRESLLDARPRYGWLSEETPDDHARLDQEATFIVDPIDGTRAFIDGQKTWAHSLAVARGGVVTAGVVYLPMLDLLYTATTGAGAHLNGRPISVSGTDTLDAAEVLATKPTLDARHWPRGVPAVKRAHRPSLAYRLGLVAEGRFDAMLTLRPAWEWDIAAGSLIMAEAGATVTDRRGGPLRFNRPHPQTDGMLGANPALHAAFLDRMT